jgi:hypothetical protein
MPIVLTFDIKGAPSVDRNRIQCLFERLGWQNLGGSSYRYPSLGSQSKHPTEDWFNHVIPALMLFRAYIVTSEHRLTKFTIDVQTTTGYEPGSFGKEPAQDPRHIELYPPHRIKSFGEKKLRGWIKSIQFPYKPGPVKNKRAKTP